MLPSGLPEFIDDNEDLVRFLTSSSQFNTTIVKSSAFLPPNNGASSVFRHGARLKDSLWHIGEINVGKTRKIYGVALFKAKDVRAQGLDVISDEPPPRHANITGWDFSTSDPDFAKSKRKELALGIAAYAVLIKKMD